MVDRNQSIDEITLSEVDGGEITPLHSDESSDAWFGGAWAYLWLRGVQSESDWMKQEPLGCVVKDPCRSCRWRCIWLGNGWQVWTP
jgi:hypothetical protein